MVLHGLSVATGTEAPRVLEREQKLQNSEPGEEPLFSLSPANAGSRCTLVKAGSAGSPLSQGCVPGASVVSGIRLDPDCLGQGGGMFDFICSSVACWQTVPAHLALVPDVWAPAIRWLNTPLHLPPPPSFLPPPLHQRSNTPDHILWGLTYSCSPLGKSETDLIFPKYFRDECVSPSALPMRWSSNHQQTLERVRPLRRRRNL